MFQSLPVSTLYGTMIEALFDNVFPGLMLHLNVCY